MYKTRDTVEEFSRLLQKPGDKYLNKMLEIIFLVFARVLLIFFLGVILHGLSKALNLLELSIIVTTGVKLWKTLQICTNKN